MTTTIDKLNAEIGKLKSEVFNLEFWGNAVRGNPPKEERERIIAEDKAQIAALQAQLDQAKREAEEEEAKKPLTERLTHKIADLEEDIFMLAMKDRWDSDDYVANSRMHNELNRLKQELEQVSKA